MQNDEHKHLLDLILETDKTLSSKGDWKFLELCDFLYDMSSKIGRTDSFFVALYNEGETSIAFPYQIDSDADNENSDIKDSFGLADFRPLKDGGVTSHVIKTNKSYMLNKKNKKILHSGNKFGTERESESALASPMHAIGLDSKVHLIGVLSMQSYQPNAYNPLTNKVFEWLAERVGRIVWHIIRDSEMYNLFIEKDKFFERKGGELNKLLNDISRRVASLKNLCKTNNVSKNIQESIDEINQLCKEYQVKVIVDIQKGKLHPSETNEINDLVDKLSEAKKKVFRLVGEGEQDKEIASHLGKSIRTVQTQIKAIREHLNKVGSNRAELSKIARDYFDY